MKAPNPANLSGLEDKTFLFLVIAASLALGWILWPFFGAILWGTILAILFAPLYRRLLKMMGQRRTIAALAIVAIVLLIVILPLLVVGALLLHEALGVYARFQAGEVSLAGYFQRLFSVLPGWLSELMTRLGLTNLSSLQESLSKSLMEGSQFVAAKALNAGQNIFDLIVNLCIVLYLLFFFARDGDDLVRRIRTAVPLRPDQQHELFDRFTTVIRATVKGNVVVAVAQGALGGVAFSLLGVHAPVLWAVVMAFLSLLPAIGSALVWFPVAVYFLVTGATWQGIALIVFGVLVIGLVDNVLRPLLVGKDTKMPDYVVLVSTLGGMALLGLNGFVIGPVIAAMFMAIWDIFASSRVRSRS